MNAVNEKKNWKKKLLREMANYWLTVLYMAVVFSVFFNYRRLILAHYQITFTNYGIGIINAMILAKVVLVAETLRLGRGFEGKPLVVPTLYKTFWFTVCVAIFYAAEQFVRGLIGGLGPTGAMDKVISRLNYEWLSGVLLVFFAFIPFFGIKELGRVLGEGTIARLFFRRRSDTGTGCRCGSKEELTEAQKEAAGIGYERANQTDRS
jgi:hypothetical protein